MNQIEILKTTSQVVALAGELEQQAAIAVDLEADSLHNYQEKICLMQVSTPERTVLIDTLVARNLDPLKKVLPG